MQTQWYKNDLYCSKEIKEFLLKLIYGEIEACAQKIAGELYIRSVKMTDKEQIIIDGKGCRYKTWDAECSLTGDHYGDNMKPCKFIDEKSCSYKQLVRKTQECENLKAEEKYLKQCCEKAGKELAKHSFDYDGKEKNLVVQAMELNEKYEKLEKVLDEIEGICLEDTRTFADGVQVRYDSLDKILDIINKVKGEGNVAKIF